MTFSQNKVVLPPGYENKHFMPQGLPWLIFFVLFGLLLPYELSFFVGGFRLSILRLTLLLVAIPLLHKFLKDKNKHGFEKFLIAYVIWLFISFSVNHGVFVSLESAGILALESTVAFFVARFAMVNLARLRFFVGISIIMVIFLLPFVLIESFSGHHFIHDFFSSVTGNYYPLTYEQRLGLTRAYGPFSHPILLGLFSATFVGIVWYGMYDVHWSKRVVIVFGLSLVTFFALSSAPILLIIFQLFAIGYNWVGSKYKSRWRLVVAISVFIYILLSIVSDRSPFMVILSRLTLDPSTSYYRLLTWDYGIASIRDNFVFGVGFHEWARPAWMITKSIDSFWLKTAMLYGFPALLFLGAATLKVIVSVVNLSKSSQSYELRQASVGWLVSFVSLVLLGFTVDFFGAIHTFYFFYLGIGASLVKLGTIQNYELAKSNS